LLNASLDLVFIEMGLRGAVGSVSLVIFQ